MGWQSDFHGEVPLGITPVRGVRRWLVDEGELTGWYQTQYSWVEGENQASCAIYKHRNNGIHPVGRSLLECVCGFYAYHDGNPQPSAGSGGVVGVIEGYGDVDIGAKGFRCDKAKILAVCPSIFAVSGIQRMLRVSNIFFFIYFVLQMGYHLTTGDYHLNTISDGVLGGLFGAITVTYLIHAFKFHRDMKLVRVNYPSVQVFYSYRRMLKKFPLTPVKDLYET